jgi:hypothetical protein
MRMKAVSALVALALLIGIGMAFAQDPKLKGAPGKLSGTITNTYPTERIFEVRIKSFEAKKRALKPSSWGMDKPKPGEVVYVELPSSSPLTDKDGKPVAFETIKKDMEIQVYFAGVLERPAPAGRGGPITEFWGKSANQLYSPPPPSSKEDEKKPE